MTNEDEVRLPEKIQALTQGMDYGVDQIGLSGSEIRLYDGMVLKIGPHRPDTENSVRMMRWLSGRLPVPEVLAYEEDREHEYVLMSRVRGKMACDSFYLSRPKVLIPLLAEGLRMFWSVDITDCPTRRSLDDELIEARSRVERGQVAVSRAEPGTFGPDGFADPAALLNWLETHRPPMDPVLSHGDFCLPNIYLEGESVSGFIDLGSAGVADRWRDISLCYRSLRHNCDGTYGSRYPDVRPEQLFDALGIAPDWEKLRYYILLDELF